jgi:hypothetical protein
MPRELIKPHRGDTRDVRRKKGKFTRKQVGVGRSLAADRRSKAKRIVKEGRGRSRRPGEIRLRKRSVETLLRHTKIELAEGEALLVQRKRAGRKAKTKLARENAKRSAAIVEDALESIAAHRELLKRQAIEDPQSR